MDGGPVDHKYHEAYQELVGYVEYFKKNDISKMQLNDAIKHINTVVVDESWNKIFRQNVNMSKGYPTWDFNLEAIAKNMKKNTPDICTWSQRYGLWPGRTWVMLASYSRWYHLSTNTLPFYNVYPRLEGEFPSPNFNIFGDDESPGCHWLHETKDKKELFHLSNKMWRWLKFKDGVHVLLGDRTEVGKFYIPDRGNDPIAGTGQAEIIPEHVHYDYKNTNVYENSRKERGVEGANPGQFLPKGNFSDESRW